MSQWKWTFSLLASPFIVLPVLLLGPNRPLPAEPRTAPAVLERSGAAEHEGVTTRNDAPPATQTDWSKVAEIGTTDAYWAYLRLHPDGPHAAEARFRLERLSVSPEPPINFVAARVTDLLPPAAAAPSAETAETNRKLADDSDQGMAAPQPGAAPAGIAAVNLENADRIEVQPEPVIPAAPPIASMQPAVGPAAGEALRAEGSRDGQPKPAARPVAQSAKPKAKTESAALSYAPVTAPDHPRGPSLASDAQSKPHRLKLRDVVQRPASALKARETAVRKKVRPHRAVASTRIRHAAGSKPKPPTARRAPPRKSPAEAQSRELRRRAADARQGSGSRRTSLSTSVRTRQPPAAPSRKVATRRHGREARASASLSGATARSEPRAQLCALDNGSLCGRN